MPTPASRVLPVLALLALAVLGSPRALAADLYDAAVAHPGRPEKDLKRDALDHPAEVLRLAGIKPGMVVADYMGANGYYSELLSYVVGPKGHVYLLNNIAYDNWSEGRWKQRIDGRLPNVEHLQMDAEHLGLADKSVDAIVLSKVYHDLYWIDPDPKDQWPTYDVAGCSARSRASSSPAASWCSSTTRPSPAPAARRPAPSIASTRPTRRRTSRSTASRSSARATLLRRADDPRDAITYEGPMVGKTDRFVLVFRRNKS